MSEAGRTATKRRDRRGPGEVLLTAVVVLAVAASLVMLLSTDTRLLRVGVVCALWAAVLGAFAMMRYRRESVADRSRVRDMQTVYQLELEREVAARREYELGVEKKVREELDGDGGELRALRAELVVLRQSIQRLYDGALPAQQIALGGDGRRELAGGRAAAVSVPEPQPESAFRQPFASPDDPPVTVETAVVSAAPLRAPGPIPMPAAASVSEATVEWESVGPEPGVADRAAPVISGAQAADAGRFGVPTVDAESTGERQAVVAAQPVGTQTVGTQTVPPQADRTQAVAEQPADAQAVAPQSAESPTDGAAVSTTLPRRRRRVTTTPAEDEPPTPMQWVTISDDTASRHGAGARHDGQAHDGQAHDGRAHDGQPGDGHARHGGDFRHGAQERDEVDAASSAEAEPTTGAHSTGRSVAEILAGLAVESGPKTR